MQLVFVLLRLIPSLCYNPLTGPRQGRVYVKGDASMTTQTNRYIMEMVRDITISAVSNSGILPCEGSGGNVADFMQEVYNKLVELEEKSN